MTQDTLLRMIFKKASVRGASVRLENTWSAVREFRTWPVCVTTLMGELTAGALLLASSLKFEGSLILQIQGDGPVRMAIVEVKNGLAIRATAKLHEGVVFSNSMGLTELVNAHGQGRCAIMLDPKDRPEGEPLYQGVVSLAGSSVAEVLENYLEQSEQIHTRLWLAANEKAASGLMIQKMPATGGYETEVRAEEQEENLHRIEMLAQTVTDKEMLTLSPQELTHRLFWEEAPDYFEPQQPYFACTCSREKVSRMIEQLGEVEALQIASEEGELAVTCDFCGKTERFTPEQISEIFSRNGHQQVH